MDDDELEQLRDEQDETLADPAHAYPSIAELVASSLDVAPIHDPGGQHELACRLIADEFFEQHRDHLDAISSLRILDQVTAVAGKVTGSEAAGAASQSLLATTLPELRARVHDPSDEEGTRERELRDAASLVLAADALARVAID